MSTYLSILVEITTGDEFMFEDMHPGQDVTFQIEGDKVEAKFLSFDYVPEEQVPDVEDAE